MREDSIPCVPSRLLHDLQPAILTDTYESMCRRSGEATPSGPRGRSGLRGGSSEPLTLVSDGLGAAP